MHRTGLLIGQLMGRLMDRRRLVGSVAVVAGSLSLGGCGLPFVDDRGDDNFRYDSTPFLPATVTLVDTRTEEEVWTFDVPVGNCVILHFSGNGSADDPYGDAEMEWVVKGTARYDGEARGSLQVPTRGARRIDVTYRDSVERAFAGQAFERVESAPEPGWASVPGAPVADEPVVEAPIADEVVVEEAVAEEAVTEEAVSEEAVSEEAVSEDAVSEDVVSEDVGPEDAMPAGDGSDEVAEEAAAEEPEATPPPSSPAPSPTPSLAPTPAPEADPAPVADDLVDELPPPPPPLG